jgi:hypothetical protein
MGNKQINARVDHGTVGIRKRDLLLDNRLKIGRVARRERTSIANDRVIQSGNFT